MTIRVAIVDDHPLILKAVAEVLSNDKDIEVVGTTLYGSELLPLIHETHPDVVFLDFGMDTETFEPVTAVRQLLRLHPNLRVIILSARAKLSSIRLLIGAGVFGYLLKSDDFSMNLAQAARKVYYQGEKVYSPKVVDLLMANFTGETLTEQELVALRLADQGLSNQAIGQILGLSHSRVKGLLNQAYAKLGVHESQGIVPRIAAIRKAKALGLLGDEGPGFPV